MKKVLLILFLFVGLNASSQCVFNQSHVISPSGPYSPGQVVTVWYTLGTFTGININWIHAFQINLGIGWTNLTPTNTPSNTGGSTGTWLWDLQHTYPSGFNFGPGWRFINSGNTGWGTSSSGPFIISFQITVDSTCTPDDLNINIEVFDDCTTGGWSNGNCCTDPAYNIYNGGVQLPPIITSNINHF
tara:strand:- start:1267 stop:1827 length:561 start_codon:yes stop_codon:yes gene_type:complete